MFVRLRMPVVLPYIILRLDLALNVLQFDIKYRIIKCCIIVLSYDNHILRILGINILRQVIEKY